MKLSNSLWGKGGRRGELSYKKKDGRFLIALSTIILKDKRLFKEVLPPQRGRPKSLNKKLHLSIRLDPDVVECLKKSRDSISAQINTILRKEFKL